MGEVAIGVGDISGLAGQPQVHRFVVREHVGGGNGGWRRGRTLGLAVVLAVVLAGDFLGKLPELIEVVFDGAEPMEAEAEKNAENWRWTPV